MPENKNKVAIATDSFTTKHLEKSFTTFHIKQQLDKQQPQVQSSANAQSLAQRPIASLKGDNNS